MTDLLDPDFAHLPLPTPKTEPAHPVKRLARRAFLRLMGRPLMRQAHQTSSDDIHRRKILLIRPDHLGDLLFLTPALRYLRSLLPDARLSLMVGPWGQALMQNNPYIDQLLICEFPGFTRRPKPSLWQPYRYLREQARQLKNHQFDLAIVLRFDHWWGAWLAAAAGIPHRFGYAIPEAASFLTEVLPYNESRHEVEQNWRLIHYAGSGGALPNNDSLGGREVMGYLEFTIPHDARSWAEACLKQHQISDRKPLVVIHPGAGAAVKLWRPEAWASLAQTLRAQYGCQIILSGGPDEAELCRQIAGQLSPAPPIVAGQTNLVQLAALLSEATLAIGPDTGPLKLAAAVNTPTVELYGPVDAKKFGPWGAPTRQRYITGGLACIACNYLDYSAKELPAHYCVRGLSVDWVLHEVVDLLKQVEETNRK
jgi:ADP-heptose:LPS heptosyltransferase